MEYKTHKAIKCDEVGTAFIVGQEVTIKFKSGGGCGGCRITKITDTGFHYCQGTGRDKSVQYKDIEEIY